MPYYRLRIRSPLHPSAVEARLRQLAKDNRPRGFWNRLEAAFDPPADVPQFRGRITGQSFKLVRVIRYENSFLPVIRGVFEADPDGGTNIRIRMTMSVFTTVFMVVWLGLVGLGAAAILLSDVPSDEMGRVIPLCMLLFGVCLPVAGFYPEARKAERLLREALSAR